MSKLEFLYATDLHGDTRKYEKVLDFAKQNNIHLLHLGADLLPKGSSITSLQRRFVSGFLKDYYKKAEGIKILAFWGNDDLFSLKTKFKEYGELLDEVPYRDNPWQFYAYGFVPDYPFGLKDACKLDFDGFTRPEQYGNPLTDINGQLTRIADIDEYFFQKGTIKEDLKALPCGDNVIMAIHCPPSNCNLDVCADGRRVGSRSVYNWLCNHKIALGLHGHIHESPSQCAVNDNLIIQPGDEQFVHITLEEGQLVKFNYISY